MVFSANAKETKTITNKTELAEYLLEKVDEITKIPEKNDENMEAIIMAKLNSGKKLTPKEMEYLRRTNPVLYAHALRVQIMINAIEEQLKHARSKEEVNRILSSSMIGISKNDPDREFIFAAVNRIDTEFHKSGAYEKLPDTIEEAQKKNSEESGDVFSDAEDEEDNNGGFDLKNWSPLTEVYDSLPTFSAGA